MTENQESNKRLFEWINPDGCWHDWRSMGPDWGYRCGNDCGATSLSSQMPDYSTESGFFALLAGLRAKEIGVTVMQNSQGCSAMLSAWNPSHAGFIYTATTDTLPQALFQAAIKAMESEQPTGEGD